jgi:hypothetical protein
MNKIIKLILKGNKTGNRKNPQNIPVHLAQIWNCLPFKKNDRSGILWQ